MNPNQVWCYLEADDVLVCSNCYAPATAEGSPCGCNAETKTVSGGPGHMVCMTEAEIVAHYFPSWRALMIEQGKADLATPENCIEDWIVVNWAEKGPHQ